MKKHWPVSPCESYLQGGIQTVLLHSLRHVHSLTFRDSNKEIDYISEQDGLSINYSSLTLLQHKLSLREKIAVYNRQRVLKQSGYNQGSVSIRSDTSFSNASIAKNLFNREGTSEIPHLERIFCPCLGREVVMSLRGVIFCLQAINIIVLSKDGSMLELAAPVPVKASNSFLRIEKTPSSPQLHQLKL